MGMISEDIKFFCPQMQMIITGKKPPFGENLWRRDGEYIQAKKSHKMTAELLPARHQWRVIVPTNGSEGALIGRKQLYFTCNVECSSFR